jgi:hypothetical protein
MTRSEGPRPYPPRCLAVTVATDGPGQPLKGGGPARRRYAAGVTAIATVVTYILFARPRHLRWGASGQECDASLPGDDLIVTPDLTATRAITVRASADQVWPWVAQLGQGRGGFYSYDFLENLAGCDIHSAEPSRSRLPCPPGSPCPVAGRSLARTRHRWLTAGRAGCGHDDDQGLTGLQSTDVCSAPGPINPNAVRSISSSQQPGAQVQHLLPQARVRDMSTLIVPLVRRRRVARTSEQPDPGRP